MAMKDVRVKSADVDVVATASESLDLEPRQGRWGHLSLSVLDATWSINADYASHVVPVVQRYAEWASLPSVQFRGSELARPISPRDDEQTLSAFLDSIADISDETLAEEVLRNNQRTSTRSGVLKSAAVRQIAGILVDHQIETLADVSALLGDVERVTAVEEALAEVPGHGFNAIRTGYLWMNAGDDQHVKPDRHILSWLTEALDREVTVREARTLLAKAAVRLDVTPWVLDHAIWVHKARD